MGRKSRYRKYKTVDPYCTGERKEHLLRQENAFNKAPKKEDFEQKPPKSYLDLMESMEQSKSRMKRVRLSKKISCDVETADQAGDKKRRDFERRPWESDDQFLGRVDRMVTSIVSREKMEIMKSGGDQELPPKKLTKEKERKLKRIKKNAAAAKKRKEEEQKEYSKAVKNEQMLEQLEKDILKDKVAFGEVAMEPPMLTKAPRKSQGKVKPGERELLLKGMMSGSAAGRSHTGQAGTSAPGKRASSEAMQKAAKRRKNMSASEKMRFDETRSAAIEAYRRQRSAKLAMMSTGER